MKVPSSAKKVFQGEIFSVFQWEEKMYDGTNATFEAIKRPATIQIIPVKDSKLYLSHEEQPQKSLCYTFLGGRQEEDEPVETTAKRELLEETGMESNDWELLRVYESDGKIEWPTYLYIARNVKKVDEPKLDGGEKIEVIEVNFEKFMELVTSENFWGKTISNDFFRIKQDPERLEELKSKLFKNLQS